MSYEDELRELSNDDLIGEVAYSGDIPLAESVAELRHRLEERDRLREALNEILRQAENVNKHCYQEGNLACSGCAGSVELIEEISRDVLHDL